MRAPDRTELIRAYDDSGLRLDDRVGSQMSDHELLTLWRRSYVMQMSVLRQRLHALGAALRRSGREVRAIWLDRSSA